MIEIRRRPLIAEYIFRQIRVERPHVLPLGLTGFETVADLDPAAFAYAGRYTAKRFNKPWHQLCCFSLQPAALHIAVRQRHVKRVLERPEPGRLKTVFLILEILCGESEFCFNVQRTLQQWFGDGMMHAFSAGHPFIAKLGG
jgi:hypothetical protein